jgi:hypothetical protein
MTNTVTAKCLCCRGPDVRARETIFSKRCEPSGIVRHDDPNDVGQYARVAATGASQGTEKITQIVKGPHDDVKLNDSSADLRTTDRVQGQQSK